MDLSRTSSLSWAPLPRGRLSHASVQLRAPVELLSYSGPQDFTEYLHTRKKTLLGAGPEWKRTIHSCAENITNTRPKTGLVQ